MKMKIKKLATAQMAHSFRSRLEASEGGGVAVIQMKELLDDNTVGCDGLVRINMEAMKDHHLAQGGDLVFRSRGSLTTAASPAMWTLLKRKRRSTSMQLRLKLTISKKS